MSYASRAGRARISSSNPQALAVCDRCGFWYNHADLQWQYDWRGAALANIRILVCCECLDTPQEQLRSIVLPADPYPIINARVEPFLEDEAGNTPVIGSPTGLQQAAVMPYNGATQKAYAVKLPVLSITANGSTTVSVTCSELHGLSTNDQISVEGLTQRGATGFYSITVGSATAFTYQTATAIPAGSLLTDTTNMITALVGLPLGQTTIPQV